MAPIERIEILQPPCRPRSSVTMSRMIMRDGYAVPSTATGLGIDWDFAAVDRLAVARAAIGPA